MDLTEAFAPGSGGGARNSGGGGSGDDLVKTDFFDFVVSPPPHCVSADGISDEEGFLQQQQQQQQQRDTCRSIFLHEAPSHDERRDHPHASSGFIKETNNNTLTALPPVSTITGSLTRNSHGCVTVQSAEHISMDQSDCDYWSTEDGKEQACSILLEDLNKYCWSAQANASDASALSRSGGDDRQNTDGAIYTLTVLNNEANSMDALDCCKSPTAQSTDSWTLRPSLDIDAILSMDSEHHERVESSADAFRAIPLSSSNSTQRYEQVTPSFGPDNTKDMICATADRRRSIGDNNNDWKLSDRNRLQETSDSAESLLRSALQGKLYSGPAQVISSPSSSSSSSSTASSSSSATANAASAASVNSGMTTGTLQIIAAAAAAADPSRGSQEPEHLQNVVSEEELLLSQLDPASFSRPGDYEKLKCIANEVVESYCNLEPVCNVATSATTVMYTLDPTSGSLGTITLAAELAPVGTVTVVTAAASQDSPIQQQSQIEEQRPQPNASSGRSQIRPKAAKKYCRRGNKAGGANSGSGSGATATTAASQQQSASATSPGNASSSGGTPAAARKERSLHYCSICSKGFKDKYSVNVHIRTHTGEKPFACSLCGKSFRQKAHLAKHYQTHVAQKPSVSSSTNANGASPSADNSASSSRPSSAAATSQQPQTQQHQSPIVIKTEFIKTEFIKTEFDIEEDNLCNPGS